MNQQKIDIQVVQSCELLQCQAHGRSIVAFDLSKNILMGERLLCSHCIPSKESYLVKQIENQLKDWYNEYGRLEQNYSIVREMIKNIQEMLENIVIFVKKQSDKLIDIEKEYQLLFNNDEQIQSFRQIIQLISSNQLKGRNEMQQLAKFFSQQTYKGDEINLFQGQQTTYYQDTLQNLMQFKNLHSQISMQCQFEGIFNKYQNYISTQQVHYPIQICDGCQQQILGDRYKCCDCEDFDFCSNCYSQKRLHIQQHVFVKLEKSSTPKLLSEYQQIRVKNQIYEHVGYACRLCAKSPISGVKYICSECPQFYYCSKCYIDQTDHTSRHQFIPVNDGLDNDKLINQILNVCQNNDKHEISCSICKCDTIIGIRYNCQNCNNFNCCLKCFSQLKTHNKQHKFMKSSHFQNIQCDGCGMKKIYGIQYQCLKCNKFNFCYFCHHYKEHKNGHAFIEKFNEYAQIEKDICI